MWVRGFLDRFLGGLVPVSWLVVLLFLEAPISVLTKLGSYHLSPAFKEPADIKSSKRDMTRSLWWVVKQRPV